MKRPPELDAYRAAQQRCTNPNNKDYLTYGARGIEFRFQSFEEFFVELGPKPSPDHMLDRKENNGHYEPGNVRWVTSSDSAKNRRNTRTQEGYLRKRFGAWHLSYYITANGQRKLKSHRLCDDTQTKSQAKQLRNEFLRTQVNIGAQNAGPMGAVAFWDEVYLPFIESSGKLKPATVHGYKQVFNQHLKSHFGTLTLSEYRTHNMSLFLTGLAKTLRPRTLNNVKWIASAIFDHAVATGQCDNNPIRDAKVLGKTLPDGVTGSYTLEEMENIISALVENVAAQLVMALSFFAGMRKGALGIRPIDGSHRGALAYKEGRPFAVRVLTPVETLKSMFSINNKKNPFFAVKYSPMVDEVLEKMARGEFKP